MVLEADRVGEGEESVLGTQEDAGPGLEDDQVKAWTAGRT